MLTPMSFPRMFVAFFLAAFGWMLFTFLRTLELDSSFNVQEEHEVSVIMTARQMVEEEVRYLDAKRSKDQPISPIETVIQNGNPQQDLALRDGEREALGDVYDGVDDSTEALESLRLGDSESSVDDELPAALEHRGVSDLAVDVYVPVAVPINLGEETGLDGEDILFSRSVKGEEEDSIDDP